MRSQERIMHILRKALSLALGGALASLAPASANTPPVADPGFAPALEMISVRDIQFQLLARGYDPGAATGAMSDATVRAIVAFQRDYGLAPDGIAGPVLQNWLHFLPRRPQAASVAVPPPASAPPAPAVAAAPAPYSYGAAPAMPPAPSYTAAP
jgi:peptidoglycan hydrolase-like protein with peptidoglycan-binding domain